MRCLNPTAFGCKTACRFHGARRPETIKKGRDHPLWVHGRETKASKADRSRKLAELRLIEAEMADLGVLEGVRWRGRKPKGS